jgi:hypothetical protein
MRGASANRSTTCGPTFASLTARFLGDNSLGRHGRINGGKKSWSDKHRRWLADQNLGHRASHIALGEALQAVADAETRQKRTEAAIGAMLEEWSLAPVVAALQALRGIGLISAVTLMAELGDLARFENPRQLMGYVGLVPSRRSTGDRVKRGGITRRGNAIVRRTLVEASWGYGHAPRIRREKIHVIEDLPKPVTDIAWKRKAACASDIASSAPAESAVPSRRSPSRARLRPSYGPSVGRCRSRRDANLLAGKAEGGATSGMSDTLHVAGIADAQH